MTGRQPGPKGGNTGMTPEQAFTLASEVANQSTCTRSNVGAVLLDATGRFLGMGYNPGADCGKTCPRGQYTHDQVPSTAAYFGLTRCTSEHAEMMAVDAARKAEPSLREFGGCVLYSTHQPCHVCRPILDGMGITCTWLGAVANVNVYPPDPAALAADWPYPRPNQMGT